MSIWRTRLVLSLASAAFFAIPALAADKACVGSSNDAPKPDATAVSDTPGHPWTGAAEGGWSRESGGPVLLCARLTVVDRGDGTADVTYAWGTSTPESRWGLKPTVNRAAGMIDGPTLTFEVKRMIGDVQFGHDFTFTKRPSGVLHGTVSTWRMRSTNIVETDSTNPDFVPYVGMKN